MNAIKSTLVRWTPKQPNKYKIRTIEGILTDEIHDPDGMVGWHIMEQNGWITRCWSCDGSVEVLNEVKL